MLLVLYLVDGGVPSSLPQPLKTQHILIWSFLNMILKHEDLRDCDLICTSQGRNCNFCNNMMLLIPFSMGSAVLLEPILKTVASPGSSYVVFMHTMCFFSNSIFATLQLFPILLRIF